MLAPLLQPADGRPLRLLVLGAHSDDIEIGCGATLLRLVAEQPNLEICWAVATGDDERQAEARASATEVLGRAPDNLVMGGLKESHLPYEGTRTKSFVHGLSDVINPDLVLTHVRHDLHQDHRTLAELVGNAFRDHLVLGFEIPKYDGDLRPPNTYVAVSEEQAHRKVELLHRHFPSQATKYWFDEQLFLGLMRIRGVEARSESGFAEGFHCTKLVF